MNRKLMLMLLLLTVVAGIGISGASAVPTFNISGFKINDTNGNGVWDPGEMGIPNWNITLLNDTGVELANTSTDAQGFYQFMSIFPGNYSIVEEVKPGFTPTNATSIPVTVENMDVTNVNFTNALVANGSISGTVTNASSGLAISGATVTADNMTTTTNINGSYNISIAPGTYNVTASATGYQSNTTTGVIVTSGNVTTQNFALTPVTTFTISGFKINDTNGNGVWDPGEMGIPNWNITLLNDTGVQLANTSTDAQGFYQFMSIFPGNYSVVEEVKPGFTPTNATSIPVTVENMDVTNVNFTNQPIVQTFSISGFKINNATGEGIPGWNITLTNSTMQTTTTTTDMNGFYEFTGLVNGTYNVSEEMQPGFTPIGDTFHVETIAGQNITNVNFTNQPIVQTFTISGFKINGTDNNGMGIENWNIMLLNPDTGAEIANMTTDSMGFYKFSNLTNGTYNVTEEVKTGWMNISAASQIINISGADVMNVNFTNALVVPPQATFSISGFKINNATGEGIPGWNITLTNSTMQTTTTTTDMNGFYEFIGLVNGTYNVSEEMQPGFTPVGETFHVETIAGQNITNVNFTNQPIVQTFTISGFKINDTNGNGVWDPGEAGIPNWKIMLLNDTGVELANTSTDAQGFYQFMNIFPGKYNIAEEVKPGFTPTNATSIPVTVENMDVTNVNFTNKPTPVAVNGSISGFKINAANGMGLQGWTIRLIGIVGKGTGTRVIKMDTTTGADGSYTFNDLPAGRYIIREELQRGFVPVGSPVKNIVLAQGESSMNNNFTNRPIQSLVGKENHKDEGNHKDAKDNKDTKDNKDAKGDKDAEDDGDTNN